MAYNAARYNLTPFNIGADSEILLTVQFAEKVTPVIGTSSETHLLVFGAEKIMRDQILGGNGVYLTLSFSESVEAIIPHAESSVVLGVTRFSETVTVTTTVQSDIYPAITGSETVELSADSYIGATIYPGYATGAEVVSEDVVTDKETFLVSAFYEKVSATIALEAVDIYSCNLNVTLEPGDILVVDAINYNVWLNGENVNWIQSGDWIDEMVRETSSISVEANVGANQLTANILYTEAYL